MPEPQKETGYSLLELVFVLGIVATMMGIAGPSVLAGLDEMKTAAAVRYMSARLQRARMDAIHRGVNTAVRFTASGESYAYTVYADGNGDGVTSRDIQRGTDAEIQAAERLFEAFSHVDFGTIAGLPAVDSSSTPPGDDPIRFGSSDMVSFTPLGTATPGTFFIVGPHGSQYALRVLGETGRTRMLKFNARTHVWESL